MESARRATTADVARIGELAREAIEELRPTRGGEVWARQSARTIPADAELAAALDDPDRLLLVGEVDGTTIGYAAARVEIMRDGGRLAVLDDLYVEDGARGVGVGEALMGLVVDWARAGGCFGIDSVALPGNRATKNFFESFGLVARAIVVHRPLLDEPGAGASAGSEAPTG